MSVHTAATKFIGSAADVVAYYGEEANDAALQRVLSYYATPNANVVFQHVGGKAAAQLDGLDLLVGLTKEQHAEIHNGRWQGVQLTQGNYAPVWERDNRGHVVKRKNPATNKLEKAPVMVPDYDGDGNPVLDPLTGKQSMKQLVESSSVAGFDVRFSMDKSWAEFLIAHPEHTDLVRSNFLKAVDTAMSWTEANAELIVTKDGGTKRTHKAEGLIWWTVIGNAARPNDVTEKRKVIIDGQERNYGSDPHLHAHCFLSASAYFGEKGWRKVDSKQLWRTALLRGQVCSLTMNKLMEDAGLELTYEADRKGNYTSQIKGSNARIRDYFSTQRNRVFDLRWWFENKHKRTPTHMELDELRHMTKLKKSKAAKAADELGNLDQVRIWNAAVEGEGLELTIADLGSPAIRPQDRKAELFARLEGPGGVGRDVESAAVFGPEVVMPAIIRSAEGLGYGVVDLEPLANEYMAEHLITVRPSIDPKHRLYTTQTILDGEETIAKRFEEMASRNFKAVPEHVLASEMGSLPHRLDADQERAVRAICGTSGVVHITGRAGSGKTSALKPAVSALRKAGLVDQVIVLAVAAKRAQETGRSVGADRGWSVEALDRAMHAKKPPKITDKTLVIFDESAMGNVFEFSRTLEAVHGARWVDVGDHLQAKAIGAAGHYETELAKRGSVELTHNYRQSSRQDIEAWNMLRDGDGHGCVANLHERGRIFVAEHRENMVTEVQERYERWLDKDYGPDQIGIVNTGSNVDLDAMNRMVQRVLIERTNNDPEFKYRVDELACYEVVDQNTGRMWRLHEGDRIIFNAGFWFEDKTVAPILNGTTGIIRRVDFDGRVRVQLDTEDHRVITVPLQKEMPTQPMGLAYAQSTTKFQGGEVDIAIVLPGNQGIADLNSGYSAVTRNRIATEVVINHDDFGEYPIHRLGEAWSRLESKEQASPYIAMWADYDREMQDVGVSEHTERLADEARETLDRGISL